MSKIAFFGLGNMGLPMALNLLKNKHTVHVFDPVPEQIKKAEKEGAIGFTDPLKAVVGVEVVLTMLPSDKHVEALYLTTGLLKALAPKTLIIECSTISTTLAQKLGQMAASLNHSFLDAPVSGGTGGAQAGTLTFMVGGEAATLEAATPIFKNMGQNIYHAGPTGMGQVAKVCNNMLLAIHMTGTSEAINLGKSLGMDPKVLSEIMRKSSGGNWSLEKYNPYPGVMENVPSSKGYAGGFGVALMCKDLGLASEAARSVSAPTPLGSLSKELFEMHRCKGGANKDFSSIIELFQKQ